MRPRASPDDPVPPTIGGYRVLDLLGQGGMGEVYKVNDSAFERELALKLCRRRKDKHVARFVSEAKLIGQLQHPAIPPIYSLGKDDDGDWYYAMKRVRGRTLQRLLELNRDPQLPENQRWNLKRLIGVLASVCQAMAYVHSRGVIHRDLKPSNIMLGNFGDVYIVDWGLAKALGRNLNEGTTATSATKESDRLPVVRHEETLLMSTASDESPAGAETDANRDALREITQRYARDHYETESPETWIRPMSHDDASLGDSVSTSSSRLTLEGQVLGSLHYMAPEQARGQFETHDQRTDIYAIGAMLWEILLDKRFRVSEDKMKLLSIAASGEHEDFGAAANGAHVEPVLRQICLKALEVDPDRRYQTMLQLTEELQAWINGVQPWKLVYESDFAALPDSEGPPPGWSGANSHWRVKGGLLCIPRISMGDSFLFLDKPIHGDVRMEIEAWVEPGHTGELTMLLAMSPPNAVGGWVWEGDYTKFVSGFGGYFMQFGSDYHEHSKIRRNGQEVVFSAARLTTGRVYRVMAEFLDGILRMEVDGEEILRLRDVIPLSGSRIGLYDYSGGVHIRRVRAWTPGVPKERSCLAVPNWLFSAGMWEPALREYDLIRESYPESDESGEADFKSALCLVELERFDEARRRLHALLTTPLASMAHIGLSRLHFRRGSPIAKEKDALIAGLRQSASGNDQGLGTFHAWVVSRCQSFRQVGDIDSAIEVLRVLHEADGVSSDQRRCVALQIARYLSEQGKRLDDAKILEEGMAAYRRVWTMYPSSYVARLALFETAQDLMFRRPKDSHELFELCSRRFPSTHNVASCMMGRAHAYFNEGQNASAHALLDAIKGLPESLKQWALYLRAELYRVENRRQEEAAVLKQILEQFPNHEIACREAREKLARIAAEGG